MKKYLNNTDLSSQLFVGGPQLCVYVSKLQEIALQLGDLLAALLHFLFGGPLDLVQLAL